MKRGDLNEMSFAIAAMRDDFNQNGDERTVSEARLYDVSVVTYPANPWAGAKYVVLILKICIDHLLKQGLATGSRSFRRFY